MVFEVNGKLQSMSSASVLDCMRSGRLVILLLA